MDVTPTISRPQASTETNALKLGDITGLHPKILELESEHGIPPFVLIDSQDLTPDSVLTLLQLRPIICRSRGDCIYCIGNIRLYQLALQFLAPNQSIPVRMSSKRSLKEIEKIFIAERLILPISTNHGRQKNKWLFSQWKGLHELINTLWPKPPLSSINGPTPFARLLDVDPRTLK